MQEDLKVMYRNLLSIKKLQQLDKSESLSAPLLINMHESYLKTKPQIMFVGKETNHWLTHESRLENKRGLNYLINNYEEAFETLFDRYDKALSDNFGKTQSDFFSEYNKFLTEGLGSVVWNNLFKMSFNQNKGEKNNFSKNSINHSDELTKLSKDIFLEELKILKPDVLIFVTGASYDSVIKEFLTGYKTICVKIKKRLWKFEYTLDDKKIICYRTIHPYYYKRNQKTEQDYYKLIREDIKNNAI